MTPSKPKPKSTKRKVKLSRRKPASKVIDQPVSELFTTSERKAEEVNVPQNAALLYVNGNNKGTIDTNGSKFGDFVIQHANRAGIRSFTVYADGAKADTSFKDRPMSEFRKIEIVAKDSRG